MAGVDRAGRTLPPLAARKSSVDETTMAARQLLLSGDGARRQNAHALGHGPAGARIGVGEEELHLRARSCMRASV